MEEKRNAADEPDRQTFPPPRKLFDHPDFEIYVPDRVTVIGAVVTTLVVVGLIFFTKWLITVGAP